MLLTDLWTFAWREITRFLVSARVTSDPRVGVLNFLCHLTKKKQNKTNRVTAPILKPDTFVVHKYGLH